MKINKINLVGLLFILLNCVDILAWTEAIPKVFTLSIAISLVLLFVSIFSQKKRISSDKLLMIYSIYVLIAIVKGAFIVENFAMFKNLISNSLCLSLPLLLIPFSNLGLIQRISRKWFAFFTAPVILSVLLLGKYPSIQFYFPLYFLILCSYPNINKKRLLPLFILIAFALFDYGGIRSQILKMFFACCSAFYIYNYSKISNFIYKCSIVLLLAFPPIFLTLGISGAFNVFDFKQYVGSEVETDNEDGGMFVDTRSFIYIETFSSAINNDYVLMGRTPALGNDSPWLFKRSSMSKNDFRYKGRFVRNKNEVCFPNVFTWIGVIGCVFYSLFYIRAIILGAFYSDNVMCRGLSIFVAARWCIGWIEDTIAFDTQHIVLWIFIALVSSNEFRRMPDEKIKLFFKNL